MLLGNGIALAIKAAIIKLTMNCTGTGFIDRIKHKPLAIFAILQYEGLAPGVYVTGDLVDE